MPVVCDDETIRQMKVLIADLKDTTYDALDREALGALENLLDEYGQDADDWASDSGYGYCDSCDGERFRDESRD